MLSELFINGYCVDLWFCGLRSPASQLNLQCCPLFFIIFHKQKCPGTVKTLPRSRLRNDLWKQGSWAPNATEPQTPSFFQTKDLSVCSVRFWEWGLEAVLLVVFGRAERRTLWCLDVFYPMLSFEIRRTCKSKTTWAKCKVLTQLCSHYSIAQCLLFGMNNLASVWKQ